MKPFTGGGRPVAAEKLLGSFIFITLGLGSLSLQAEQRTIGGNTYSSYYETEVTRPVPKFELDETDGAAYLSGAPRTGSGKTLTPYGRDAQDWVSANLSDPASLSVSEGGRLGERSLFAVADRAIDGVRNGTNPEDLPPVEGLAPRDMEEALPEVELDDTPIIEELKGIQLVSAWEKNVASEAGTSTDRSSYVQSAPESESLLIDSDLEVPEDVRLAMASQIGQPLSLASLDAMLRDAIIGYQGSDIPVVDIAIPEQEITDGILRLDVLEARLGGKGVEDAESPGSLPQHTDPNHMMAQIQTQEGEKLRSSELLDDVAWMNRYPFRRVDLVYTPGEDYGETDVVLRTISRKPWLFYTGIDNTGNDVLGEYRWNSSLTLGNPFGLDDHLVAYQFSTDLEFDHITSHSFVYTLPVYWNSIREDRKKRHMLTILGAYANVATDLDFGVDSLELEGFSAQSSLRYLIPIKRSTDAIHELEFGYDWKASNNNLEFNTIEVFDTTTHIHQFTVGWNSRYEQFLGLMGFANIDLDVVFSPGNLSDRNMDDTFRLAREDAESNYAYTRGSIEWHVPVNTWEVVARLTGQWSGSNLLATETLGAGGFEDVRGFEERVVRGDRGVKGTVELYTPDLTVRSFLANGTQLETWQGLVFFDFAHLEDVEKLEGDPSSRSMSSSGVGVRYGFEENFNVAVDYGWVIDASGFDKGESGRLHFRGRLNF